MRYMSGKLENRVRKFYFYLFKPSFSSPLRSPRSICAHESWLRIFVFADAGNVWRDGEPITTSSLRSSAGLGLSWISPVGPLKLSWGSPLKKLPTDRIQRFQFQIGTAF